MEIGFGYKRGPGKFGAIPHEEKCRRKQLLN